MKLCNADTPRGGFGMHLNQNLVLLAPDLHPLELPGIHPSSSGTRVSQRAAGRHQRNRLICLLSRRPAACWKVEHAKRQNGALDRGEGGGAEAEEGRKWMVVDGCGSRDNSQWVYILGHMVWVFGEFG